MDVAAASAWADVIMMLLPDTEIGPIYEADVAPNLNDGDALLFAHGFNVRFGYVKAPAGVDVAMVASRVPVTWCGAPTPRAAACRA